VPLTAAEILRRGSPRINGPWLHLEVPKELALPVGDPQTCARQHLEFLIAWGIPGGIVGQFSEQAGFFREAISALLERAPKAKVLVIGEKPSLATFTAALGTLRHTRYDGGKNDPPFSPDVTGLVLATPAAVSSLDGLRQIAWTLLCVVEADEVIKSSSSRFHEQLAQYKKRLVIGSFLSREFLARNAKRQAITQVWGLAAEPAADLVWTYGLRDPASPPEPLPPPYTIQQRLTSEAILQPAEIPLAEAAAPESVPIPPRPRAPAPDTRGKGAEDLTREFREWQQTVPPTHPRPAQPTPPEEPRFTFPVGDVVISVRGVGFHENYGAQHFVKEALKYVARRERSAAFVPFMCYWPTYDSMTPAQRKWYFYWRGEVRDDRYPETDLSYIFVHVYELINNVGVKNSADGYAQLFALWKAYREKYAKLDRYLMDWIADYLVVNKSAVDLATFYTQAMGMKAYAGDPDILLSRYAKAGLNSLPMDLIDRLSDYRPRKSKFYNDGNSDLVERYLPLSVGRVDACLRQKKGKGILQSYHPDAATRTHRVAFQSAVYAGEAREIELPPVIPYSQYPPLREFMTGVVKHTENDLRALRSCKSKLRGYSLDDDVKATIDAFVAEASKKAAGRKAAAEFRVDFDKARQEEAESDEVRDMLLAGEQQENKPLSVVPAAAPAGAAPSVPFIERPASTPAGPLTDLNAVNRILAQLSPEERQLLDIFRRCGWEAGDAALAESMPGSLVEDLAGRINHLALHDLPDMLIHSEDGKKVVAEDCRNELESLLARQAAAAPKTGRVALAPDLPAEWAEFVGKLADYQIHVLRAILRQQNPVGEIRRLAAEHATMPETLVEQINELAHDTLGDFVIVSGSSPPVIEEEDVQMVEKVTQSIQ
jgi:hypothetical protein